MMKKENEVRDSSNVKMIVLTTSDEFNSVQSTFYHGIKFQHKGFSLDQRVFFQGMDVTRHNDGYQRFMEHLL